MDVSKCTKGPVEAEQILGGENQWRVCSISEDCYIADVYWGAGMRLRRNGGEPRHNALLVAEAFNVATETGRSPRQLADWQAGAVKMIQKMRAWLADNLDCQCEHGHVCHECNLLGEMSDLLSDLLRSAGAIEPSKQPRRTTIE